jgi:hypothetical protein
MEDASIDDSPRERFLVQLKQQISNPVHKRLIEAYKGEEPVPSMESALQEILLGVMHRED